MRATAELTCCSHHTVARHVAASDAGQPIAEPVYRGRVSNAVMPKIEEWIEASKGKIRATKAHEKLLALGYEGSERSTRRAVAQVRADGGSAMSGCTGRGSRNRACGFSTISATGP